MMNFDMSMHTLAVHAPDSAKRLHRPTTRSTSGSKTSDGLSKSTGRRSRTATNDSDSSTATKSSCDHNEAVYDYRPIFHFNLSSMLQSVAKSVDGDLLRSPQPSNASLKSIPSSRSVDAEKRKPGPASNLMRMDMALRS
ncbi:hypothetical protein AeMF1_009212 [Aphanomyces euteiches]|nr:hypothetical protein AeMF1_009212 [Aphanomyces euteiches]KAH9194178.1 hypothetical protein AeNC1_003829 [Aphanomyces euteiches]